MANDSERMGRALPTTASGQRTLTRWLLVLAYVALIFTLSAQPNLHVPGTLAYRDKFCHILEYGGLSWLVHRAALQSWPAAGTARRALLAILAISALGACDEKFQANIPGRDSSVYDWLADTTGATLAQGLALVLARTKRPGAA